MLNKSSSRYLLTPRQLQPVERLFALCMCTCQQSKTKTIGHIVTELGMRIVRDKF